MKTLKLLVTGLFIFTGTLLNGQLVAPDTTLLKKHITILASDDMEGRETGTEGEKKAYEYISGEFRKAGLLPKGTKGYIQSFEFNAGSVIGEKNSLVINGKSLKASEQFFPLGYSANKSFSGKIVSVGNGIVAPGMDDYQGKNDLKGKVFLMEYGYPEGMDPHSRQAEYADIRTRIDSANTRGAAAVIFINTDKDTESPAMKYSNRITPSDLPVLFVMGDAAALLAESKDVTVKGEAEIKRQEKTGHNILGFIDNKAKNTVVIGAHYDHLGYGIEGSLFRGDKKEIHNGADDNASGTAALIELGRMLKASSYSHNNYLFIAFSGEEMGLLGSNNLVKHFPFPIEQVNYMLNMDMVGRLKPEDPVLLINGTGTSPEWKTAIEKIKPEGFTVKTTESGVGPSDHTSFYLRDIPVLHFFSGTHPDYHKPEDDESKINYGGIKNIVSYMMQLIGFLDKVEQIEFTKTNDSANEETPRFKVTMGVVPDYAFDGEGMRIDGVSEDKPAKKAGLLTGDVVIQLGEHKVKDMMSYMKALGKFSKGDTTTVVVKRGTETVTKEIAF